INSGGVNMEHYKTFKTFMGHKIRMRMSQQEVRERRILTVLIWTSPFVACWLFALFARMI
ncbi:MAG: hypothetical protein II008_08950, partial [Oscillospiraceae bacterium]|nr:hypothetical protein [Oscillospiraceae bacterium]